MKDLTPRSIAELVDKGEAQAIAVAYETNATLLVDDKAGRRCASRFGIPVIGSLGILLKLKELGKTVSIKPHLDKLQENGYWYHPSLIDAVLKKSGETV